MKDKATERKGAVEVVEEPESEDQVDEQEQQAGSAKSDATEVTVVHDSEVSEAISSKSGTDRAAEREASVPSQIDTQDEEEKDASASDRNDPYLPDEADPAEPRSPEPCHPRSPDPDLDRDGGSRYVAQLENTVHSFLAQPPAAPAAPTMGAPQQHPGHAHPHQAQGNAAPGPWPMYRSAMVPTPDVTMPYGAYAMGCGVPPPAGMQMPLGAHPGGTHPHQVPVPAHAACAGLMPGGPGTVPPPGAAMAPGTACSGCGAVACGGCCCPPGACCAGGGGVQMQVQQTQATGPGGAMPPMAPVMPGTAGTSSGGCAVPPCAGSTIVCCGGNPHTGVPQAGFIVQPIPPEWSCFTWTPDQLQQVTATLEYYFSDANLCHDTYLRDLMTPEEGWVPLTLLRAFPRMRLLGVDEFALQQAVMHSTQLELDSKAVYTRIAQKERRDHWVAQQTAAAAGGSVMMQSGH